MGIGFSWKAKAKQAKNFWQTIAAVADEQGIPMEIDNDQAWLRLAPLGGELYLQLEDDGTVSGDCTTTPAGAGLHKAAVDFVRLLAERAVDDLVIGDETDYADDGDFEKMRQEHFYTWLQGLLNIVQDALSDKMESIRLSWDMDQYGPENIPQTVVTPLGRWAVDDMMALVEEEGIEALAKRFFIWNNVEKDALYHRNKALNGLWEHCYFRPSTRSEQDKFINDLILDELELAMQLDPTLPEPLEAYREVCALAGRAPHIPPEVLDMISAYPIGYRKGMVWETIGNLALYLPGSYQYSSEPQENGHVDHLWSDDTAGCWWRVTAMGFEQPIENFHDGIFEGASDIQTIELDERGSRLRMGYAGTTHDEDGVYHHIVAQALSGKQITVFTIIFEQACERETIMARLAHMRVQRMAEEDE